MFRFSKLFTNNVPKRSYSTSPQKNLYDILRVNRNAHFSEIKKSYYELAKKFHPDAETGDIDKFKELHSAFEVLKDPVKKSNYDFFNTRFNFKNEDTMFSNKNNDINKRDVWSTYSPLMSEVVNGGEDEPNIGKIESLLKQGANPNLGLGDDNLIVYHVPLDENSPSLILLMCRSKAYNGFTQNIKEVADLLISYGADVNHTTASRLTALHYAYRLGQHEWASYLLSKGARSDIKDITGKMPIDYYSFDNEITKNPTKGWTKTP